MTPLSAYAASTYSPSLQSQAARTPVSSATVLQQATPVQRAKADKAAQGFEASFLSSMLGSMFEGTEISAPFGGGEGEAAFRSFLTDAMATSMAKHGGVGLAKSVSREMLKLQGLK